MNLIVTADFGVAVNDNVRLQHGAFADFDVSANNTKRTNVDVSANHGAFFYNGGRMNKSGFINHVSGLPATRTHHRRFANHFTVNQRNAFETG